MSLVIPLWGIYLMKKKKTQRKKTDIYNSRITKQELIHYPKKKKKQNIYTNYNTPLWLWDQNDNDVLSQDGKCRCHCIKL